MMPFPQSEQLIASDGLLLGTPPSLPTTLRNTTILPTTLRNTTILPTTLAPPSYPLLLGTPPSTTSLPEASVICSANLCSLLQLP
ncbi:hypothetical protein CEXT_463931 [Caerostris extrusa]|uniref:Uncharacterized protein n=1 Tax=Caerostris extrusa TaxID=172846 RepID=A0AAV4VW81_CAEEX|nr:hypothetical protein CEXT_463931 [Caerostris extrusa]